MTPQEAMAAFADIDDQFNSAQRVRFGCETGWHRHHDRDWDWRMRALWRRRCQAWNAYRRVAGWPVRAAK